MCRRCTRSEVEWRVPRLLCGYPTTRVVYRPACTSPLSGRPARHRCQAGLHVSLVRPACTCHWSGRPADLIMSGRPADLIMSGRPARVMTPRPACTSHDSQASPRSNNEAMTTLPRSNNEAMTAPEASRRGGGVPKLLEPVLPVHHPIFPIRHEDETGSQRDPN